MILNLNITFILKGIFALVFTLVISNFIAQTSSVLTYTGSPQDWVVPACVTSITVSAYGADGGGSNGGNGASVTGTFSVTPGQTIQVIVGGSGGCPGAGYNGGGSGQNANTSANGSCGGGGKSQINIGGSPVLIAAGGGGQGGGDSDGAAGIGGCASGTAGSTTFGVGAGGGTQSAGGTGGPPWASGGYTGQNGSLGQGGNGASDPCYNNSPGGGGGGGYYGGGGGGSDCWDSSPYGGGGGGGGSSLVPAGGSCSAGVNNGQGYVTISYTGGTASVSNTGPYCQGATIQLNSSASAGSTYAWTGPDGFVSSLPNPTILNATAVNAGTYTLTISGGACNGTVTTDVVVNSLPTPNAGSDQSVCLGDPISLSGTLSNASNTSQWSYVAPGIVPAPTVNFAPSASNISPTVTVNQVGDYYFIFQEQNALCPIQYDTVVVNVSELSVSTSFVNPSCAGSNDGSITITSPGATEYSYNGGTIWVANSNQGSFIAGNYTVCARTATGCQQCVNVVLTDPAPSAIIVSNTGAYCEGETIQLNTSTSGGIYSWTGPNGFLSSLQNPTIPNANPSYSGTYYLSITGGTCIGNGSTDVIVNPSPLISAADVSMCESETEDIVAFGADTYTWSPATYLSSTTGSTVTFTPGATISYTVTGTDANGCVGTTTVDAIVFLNPTIEAGNNLIVCDGDQIILSGTGAGMGGNYTWDNGVSNGTTFAPPIGTTVYEVTGTTSNGCSSTDNLTVTVDEYPIVNFTVTQDQFCIPVVADFVNTSASGINCVWTFDNGQTVNNCGSVTQNFTSPGVYGASLYLESPNGCSTTLYQDSLVIVDTTPEASFVPNPVVFSVSSPIVNFENTSTGATSYIWDFGHSGPTSTEENPNYTYPSSVASYTITLLAYSDYGCVDTFQYSIGAEDDLLFYIPNAFTPDGDSFNQTFQPVFTSGFDPQNFVLYIFNRWGEMVFESHDATIGWDGTYAGIICQEGTYTWKIEFKALVNDERKMYVGHVSLTR